MQWCLRERVARSVAAFGGGESVTTSGVSAWQHARKATVMAERMSKGTKGCSASAASSSSGGGVGLPTWSTSASTSASISTSISASLRRMVRSSWSRRAVGPSAMLPRPTAIPAAHEMSTARPTGRTLTAIGPVIRMKATATATVIATKSGCRSCARRAGARVRWTAVIMRDKVKRPSRDPTEQRARDPCDDRLLKRRPADPGGAVRDEANCEQAADDAVAITMQTCACSVPIWIGIKLASGIKLATQCPDPYLGCRPENSQKTKDLYSSPSYIYIDVLLARPRTHSLVGTCVNVLIKRLPSKVSLHYIGQAERVGVGPGRRGGGGGGGSCEACDTRR